ncbi:hypothetical protein ACFLU5_11140 [Bacteroidota bacterium]
MKRLLILASLATLTIFGCNCGKNKDTNQAQVVENEIDTQNIEAILASPDDYAGLVVRVSGLVTHVCKHSGQRLHLSSPDSENWIRVEATGNISNFQRELEGSSILVEGEFKKQVIDDEYLTKWENELGGDKEHHAADHGDENNVEGEKSQIEHLRERLANTEDGKIISYWIDGKEYSEI